MDSIIRFSLSEQKNLIWTRESIEQTNLINFSFLNSLKSKRERRDSSPFAWVKTNERISFILVFDEKMWIDNKNVYYCIIFLFPAFQNTTIKEKILNPEKRGKSINYPKFLYFCYGNISIKYCLKIFESILIYHFYSILSYVCVSSGQVPGEYT